jgi:hypothetical protein
VSELGADASHFDNGHQGYEDEFLNYLLRRLVWVMLYFLAQNLLSFSKIFVHLIKLEMSSF